ncbi:MAG: hypothetical protein WBE03_16600 [Terracidiphilus sp.]
MVDAFVDLLYLPRQLDALGESVLDVLLLPPLVEGYDLKCGHRIVLDPNDPAKIYVTTFGGGVWHGPRLLVPRAQSRPL